MHIYCGTDIIEVDRIKNAIDNTKGFKENIYSDNEIKAIDGIKSRMKYQRYAGRFAAKEAIYKAMSKILIENKIPMDFRDIEIINQGELSNRPKIVYLNEKLRNFIEKKKIEVDISISHIDEYATANAVVKIN